MIFSFRIFSNFRNSLKKTQSYFQSSLNIIRSLIVELKSWCSSIIVDERIDFQSSSSFKIRHDRDRKLDRKLTSAHWAFDRTSINCMQIMSICCMIEANSTTLLKIITSMKKTNRKRIDNNNTIMTRYCYANILIYFCTSSNTWLIFELLRFWVWILNLTFENFFLLFEFRFMFFFSQLLIF